MSHRLPGSDLVVLALHSAGNGAEAVGHLFLRQECLDDTQATQGLLDLAHGIAPHRLRLGGFASELAPQPSHEEHHGGSEQQHKYRQLPGYEHKRAYIEKNQDGILDEHVQGSCNGILDFLDVSAHTGHDIALALLAEVSQRQGQQFAIQLVAKVFHDSVPNGDHNRGRAEIAGGFDRRNQRERKAQGKQHGRSAPLPHRLGNEPVEVVDGYVLDSDGHRIPGNELILHLVYVEQDLQNGNQQREREHVEDGGQYVHHDRAAQIAPVRPNVTLEYPPEIFHPTKPSRGIRTNGPS